MTTVNDPAGPHSLPERHPWLALAACLVAGALVSVCVGQDASWDLKNYHLYNAWAWWHDRSGVDLAPAGLQSFFNPILDLPYAALALGPLRHWPRILAALQGLYAGAVIYLVWAIVAVSARCRGARMDRADAGAFLVGISGAALGSQVGTTSNEMQVALLVLAAVLVALKGIAAAPEDRSRRWRRVILAGALAGLAAGLKPTAIVYVPALGLAVALAPGLRRGAVPALLAMVAAGIAFVVAYGAWGWHLWRLTGNPIFPLFNDVFHSPWTAAVAATDGRFRPHEAAQWVFYPFWWAFKASYVVTEVRMRDPRFAFAFLALLILAARHLWRQPAALAEAPAAERQSNRLLLVFTITAYAAWLALFAIYRYAIAIEALTGWVIMLALRTLLAARDGRPPGRGFTVAVVIVTLLLVAGTRYPRWGRTAYADRVFDVATPVLPPHSLVIFVGQPGAYLAPFLDGKDTRFMSVTALTARSRGHVLWARSHDLIGNHVGPRFVVLRDDPQSLKDRATLHALIPGAHILSRQCHRLDGAFEHSRRGRDRSVGLRLCPLALAAPQTAR